MTSKMRENTEPSPFNLYDDKDKYTRMRKSKLRFKSSKGRLNPDSDRGNLAQDDIYRHRYHHHRSKRRERTDPLDDSSLQDDPYLPNTSPSQHLDPETAFRESLFDAMADDEGALFWEGVYGQPIPKIPPVKEGPTGKLEAMTEDEYAAYVRAEMYKKTHQYLMEEKARRDRAKKERDRRIEQARQEEDESRRFRRQVEESLRRRRERKERERRSLRWVGKWEDYEKRWENLCDNSISSPLRIPWPTLRMVRNEITKEQVEEFFLNAPTSGKPEDTDLLKILKTERVRWHPDKFQQRFRGQNVDDATMRDVTAVFQIIDCIWTESRDRGS